MTFISLRVPSVFGVGLEVYIIIALLATPCYLLWHRLFRKRFETSFSVALCSAIAALGTALCVYAFLAIVIIGMLSYYSDNEFSQRKWFANKDKRYELSKDIIQSKVLIGKTKAQVKQLLGENDEADETSNYWRYSLGFTPSIGNIDPAVLVISFENGRVVEVGQHQS